MQHNMSESKESACPRSLTGCHLASPDEVGFDVESKQLEYSCLRCGTFFKTVSLDNMTVADFEVLFHILVEKRDEEEDVTREELVRDVAAKWKEAVGEDITETTKRLR